MSELIALAAIEGKLDTSLDALEVKADSIEANLDASVSSRASQTSVDAIDAKLDALGGDAPIAFSFPLEGSQMVPPITVTSTGSCTATLSSDQTSFDISCTHTVVDTIFAFISKGAPLTNGPVVFPMGAHTSPVSATWALTQTDVAELLAGDLYVTIGSFGVAGGELRGQIVGQIFQFTIHDDLEQALAAIEGKLDNLDTTVGSWASQASVDAIEAKLDADLFGLQTALGLVDTGVGNVQTSVDAIEGKLDGLESGLGDAASQASVDALAAAVVALGEQLAAIEAKLDEMTQRTLAPGQNKEK